MNGLERAASLFEPFRAHPGAAGVFTDFDGTLAEIVDDPAAAQPYPGAVDALHRLAGRYRRVGVISGRPVVDLISRLGGEGFLLSGLYGLESLRDGERADEPGVAQWRDAVEDVAATTESQGPPRVVVERKGASVTLHFRAEPERDAEVRRWAEAQAARTGLTLSPARKSYELRPPVARHKGMVLVEEAEGLDCACFFGDDLGDLDCFDALDQLAARGVTVVRVGVRSDEAPAELLERADLILDGPAEVVAVLDRLAG